MVLVHRRPTRVEECRALNLDKAHPQLLAVAMPRLVKVPGSGCRGKNLLEPKRRKVRYSGLDVGMSEPCNQGFLKI